MEIASLSANAYFQHGEVQTKVVDVPRGGRYGGLDSQNAIPTGVVQETKYVAMVTIVVGVWIEDSDASRNSSSSFHYL